VGVTPGRVGYFSNGDETFDVDDVRTYSKCMPADTYKWGFSSLMLFTFCIVTIFVGLLVLNLHYDALCFGTADQYKLKISAYRDVLDLATELRTHFGATHAERMSGPVLEKEMRQRPARASLDTTELRDAKVKTLWSSSRLPTWDTIGRRASTTKGAEDYLLSVLRPDKNGDGGGEGRKIVA